MSFGFLAKFPVTMELSAPAKKVLKVSQSFCLINVKCFRAQRLDNPNAFPSFSEIYPL